MLFSSFKQHAKDEWTHIESGKPNKNNCCQLEIQEIPTDVDLEKLPVTFDALHYDEAGFVQSESNRGRQYGLLNQELQRV